MQARFVPCGISAHDPEDSVTGRSVGSARHHLNVDLLGDHKRVINLDAKIPDRAFDLCMTERTRVIIHILLSH
jgi:hypothetical protein